jgi:hypothetical protein
MLAETYRIRGSNLKMLPNPTADKWPGPAFAINWLGEMKEFHVWLQKLTSSKEVGRHPLLDLISREWEKMSQYWEKHDIDMREKTHDALDSVNDVFRDRESFSGADIKSVFASHLTTVLNLSDEIVSAVNDGGDGKLVKYYFEHVFPEVKADTLKQKHSDEEKSKRGVIWLGLLFRMICWFSLHDFDKNDVNMMPADMKGSRMPVYIG